MYSRLYHLGALLDRLDEVLKTPCAPTMAHCPPTFGSRFSLGPYRSIIKGAMISDLLPGYAIDDSTRYWINCHLAAGLSPDGRSE